MVFGLLCNLSCQNQNEEDLFGSICDTTTVSWTQDIEPIIQSKCLHCHYDQSPITPFSLQGYQNVLIRVNTGQLEPAINHTGPVMMPKDGPKLPECELSKINKWIREGAANN
jgi:hypothetical protein